MLATDVESVPTAQPVVQSTVVTTDDKMAQFEMHATSLRRSCTALFFFSLMCSGPWPNAAWLGVVAAVAVLCAAPSKLLWRARVARFLSAIVAIFAAIALVTLLMAIRNDAPERISNKVHAKCVSMPPETYDWVRQQFNEHTCPRARAGLHFLSRHTSSAMEHKAVGGDEKGAMLVGNSTVLVAHEWSQEQACDVAAFMSKHVAKMMMIGMAFAHVFLFVSAFFVFKRACRLRCAAYRCGLLRCSAYKCGLMRNPQAVVQPAAKELA